MARLFVAFTSIGSPASQRGSAPALQLAGAASELLFVDAQSRRTTIVAPPAKIGPLGFSDGCFVSLTAIDAAMWVDAGPDPVASIPAAGVGGRGWLLRSGESRDFAVSPGDRIAAIAFT